MNSSIPVLDIIITTEQGKTHLTSCSFIKGFGIKGDLKGGTLGREVVLFVNAPLKPGLCTKRFKPNLLIEGLNVEALKINDIITLGDISLKVTNIGKRCFPECTLITNKIHCPLKTNVIFTSVFKEGLLKI